MQNDIKQVKASTSLLIAVLKYCMRHDQQNQQGGGFHWD